MNFVITIVFSNIFNILYMLFPSIFHVEFLNQLSFHVLLYAITTNHSEIPLIVSECILNVYALRDIIEPSQK